MQKLILINHLSPGDLVMLTAAVRDLHRYYPGRFITDVRTGSPELWENNPYLTPLEVGDPEARSLACHYPLVEKSNQRPVHFIQGFIEFLNDELGLAIKPTRMAGDIHLSAFEKKRPSPVEERIGAGLPYWIIVAGGKLDFTIKWWHFRRWQKVVDHFRDQVLFVQVGEKHHYHPLLNGVLDMRGRTPLRELLRLVYHAQGVLCPVTFLMHLAAAVECPTSGPGERPCVVVAGGREPVTWEAYPGHEFIHTIGRLACCATGGCWRSRSVPLGDGDIKDEPQHVCVDVVQNLPRCMDLITPADVIERINSCIERQQLQLLTGQHAEAAAPFLHRGTRPVFADEMRRTVPMPEHRLRIRAPKPKVMFRNSFHQPNPKENQCHQ
jgi:ADP-heptose:LPS heptosyltransferase